MLSYAVLQVATCNGPYRAPCISLWFFTILVFGFIAQVPCFRHRLTQLTVSTSAQVFTASGVIIIAVIIHTVLLNSVTHLLQAISILDSIKDEEVRHKPAVLATQIGLQEQQQDLAGALSTAQEGLQWWQNSMTADKPQKAAAHTWLLQQLVHLQLKTGNCASLFVLSQQSVHLQLRSSDRALTSVAFCCCTWLLQQLVGLQLKTGNCASLLVCLQQSAHLQFTTRTEHQWSLGFAAWHGFCNSRCIRSSEL